MPKASQQDIAKLLDISQAAVSKALRDDPTISEKVRRRVKELAGKLNYRSNRLARSLIDGTAPIVGLVMPHVFGAVMAKLLQAIEKGLRDLEYLPLLVQIHSWDHDNRKLIELLFEYKVQGIIVFLEAPSWESDFFQELIDANEKIIFLNPSEIPEACSVASDDRKGAVDMVSHLVKLGHRNIAFCWREITGNKGVAGNLRLEGYREGMRRHKLQEKIIETSNLSPAQIKEALLHHDRPSTAIFCIDDHIAIEIETALDKQGVDIPGELSICGFGDNFFYPDAMRIPLTTVSHSPEMMGEKAVALLAEMISGRRIKGVNWIPCKLISRKSVKILH